MSERAENMIVSVDTHFYRFQFNGCGCEFLSRAEWVHIGPRIDEMSCILHGTKEFATFQLDENGFWRLLTATYQSVWFVPNPSPTTHGLHPDDAYWSVAHDRRRKKLEAEETL